MCPPKNIIIYYSNSVKGTKLENIINGFIEDENYDLYDYDSITSPDSNKTDSKKAILAERDRIRGIEINKDYDER